MTGVREWNHPAFHRLQAKLEKAGHTVLSPARLNEALGHRAYTDALRLDLALLLSGCVDAIVVMDDWAKSRGARVEVAVARAIGLPVYRHDRVPAAEGGDAAA